MFSSIYSTYPLLRDKYLRTAQLQRMPLYQIKPSLPVVGGHSPRRQRVSSRTWKRRDAGVGGAIQGIRWNSPGGRAMRQAIDAAVAGMPLAEKAKGCPELRRAMEVWRL
jgi:2,3-diketo-5-methylthiopentyl-1-phosphate enolase